MQTIGANQKIAVRLATVRELSDDSVGGLLNRNATRSAMDEALVEPGGQFPKQVSPVNDHANWNSELSFQVEE